MNVDTRPQFVDNPLLCSPFHDFVKSEISLEGFSRCSKAVASQTSSATLILGIILVFIFI